MPKKECVLLHNDKYFSVVVDIYTFFTCNSSSATEDLQNKQTNKKPYS